MSRASRHPLLLVISAPSGAGKTTLCERLLHAEPNARYSTSCTTRPPRKGEQDGEAYCFLDDAAFAERVNAGEFLEWAEVHGHRYGTLEKTVRDHLEQGHHVIMDVDVQGARQLRAHVQSLAAGDALRTGYVDVFIAPPSEEMLEQRLRKRGQDSEQVIALRMRNAREEMKCRDEYRYLIINDDLEKASEELRAIFKNECARARAK